MREALPSTTFYYTACTEDVLVFQYYFALQNLHKDFALHSTLITLRFALHIPQSTADTPHSPDPSLLQLSAFHFFTFPLPLSTDHSTLPAQHSALHTPHFALHTPHSTLHTSHSALDTPHFTLHTLHSTLQTSHSPLHTSHSPLHAPQSTLHTSHSMAHSPTAFHV